MAILGIDEVGRGPLAGPLVVGAVILPEEWPEWVEELRDSKKLSAKKREKLSELILAEATTGLGIVMMDEIDRLGMFVAMKMAVRRAVMAVREKKVPFSEIIIDGNQNYLSGTSLSRFTTTVVKGDDLIKEISAASIIAKVWRDNYMKEMAEKYPGYGFERNAGYGTKEHREALEDLGVCPIHRLSFEPCKSLVGFSREEFRRGMKDTTWIGNQGEEAVCRHLLLLGHEIVSRNFKTKFCEIDVVSIFEERIYFTEVKYRESGDFGGGLAAITAKKQGKMRFAAEVFLKFWPEFSEFDPVLAVAAVTGVEFRVEDWFVLGA